MGAHCSLVFKFPISNTFPSFMRKLVHQTPEPRPNQERKEKQKQKNKKNPNVIKSCMAHLQSPSKLIIFPTISHDRKARRLSLFYSLTLRLSSISLSLFKWPSPLQRRSLLPPLLRRRHGGSELSPLEISQFFPVSIPLRHSLRNPDPLLFTLVGIRESCSIPSSTSSMAVISSLRLLVRALTRLLLRRLRSRPLSKSCSAPR